MSPRCPHCGDPDVDVACWLVEGTQAWLCPGCVADARAAGYRVAWLPERRRTEAEAFREALGIQAAIVEQQEQRGRELEEAWAVPAYRRRRVA